LSCFSVKILVTRFTYATLKMCFQKYTFKKSILSFHLFLTLLHFLTTVKKL